MTPRLATFLVFGVNGAMIGTWVAHIPWVQEHLDLSKATLGLCLLSMAAGALVAMPVTGHVVDRRGSASVTRWATLVFCLMLPLPLLATSAYMLGAILFVFGASNGAMDVAMNAHGVAIQQRLGRPVMSSLHGGWSVGGFTAAGVVAIAAAAGLDPRLESLIVGACLLAIGFWVTGRLGAASAHATPGTGLALPTRPVLLIGGLCFLVMMAEGAIADWGGIYLRHNTGASSAAAALAFTAFSLGMAVSRLGGDVLNARIGALPLLRLGTALVAVMLGGVLLIGETVPAVVGFAVCGLGIANAVPLLFSAAGRIDPPGPSLAAAFTLGYTGFIVGPPLIGVLADQTGLPQTLALLIVALLAVTAFGGRAMGTSRDHGTAEAHAAVEEIADRPGVMQAFRDEALPPLPRRPCSTQSAARSALVRTLCAIGLAGRRTGNERIVGRNVLVVEAVEHSEAAVRSRLGDDVDEVRVVVPVVRQGFLDWLANDERAASKAEEEASRLAGELPQVIEASKGEADLMLAIQDALATFDADEIIVALHPEDEALFAERVAAAGLEPSFDGVPVRAIVVHDDA